MATDLVEVRDYTGRKNNDLIVKDRRDKLAEMMASCSSNAKMKQYYAEIGLSEAQLYSDKVAVMKEWATDLYEKINNRDDTLAELITVVRKSIEIATNSNQPSAMQSGTILLQKLLDFAYRAKNKISDDGMEVKSYELDFGGKVNE